MPVFLEMPSAVKKPKTQQIVEFRGKALLSASEEKVIKIVPRAGDWQEIPVDLAYYC